MDAGTGVVAFRKITSESTPLANLTVSTTRACSLRSGREDRGKRSCQSYENVQGCQFRHV